jgi:hypothetical protein
MSKSCKLNGWKGAKKGKWPLIDLFITSRLDQISDYYEIIFAAMVQILFAVSKNVTFPVF